MSYIKKTFAILLIALCLFAVLCPAAYAQDSSLSYTGHSLFRFNADVKLEGSDLFPDFKSVMPGDTLTQTINIRNTADCCDLIKVYVRPVPNGIGQDFMERLSLTIAPAGSDEGEERSEGLGDSIFLCSLRTGESAAINVTLQVPAELGNAFANRTGGVDWVFTVEEFELVSAEAGLEITEIQETEIPLADLGHGFCILHWLLLLAALICLTAYIFDSRSRRRRIAELKQQLGID